MASSGKYVVLLVMMAAALLITPYALRILHNNDYTINSESYYNLRLSNNPNDSAYDTLQGHSIPLNIIDIAHIAISPLAWRIICIVLGLLSVILAYMILKHQNISEKTIIAILTLMIVSPIFLYIFTDLKYQAFIIFLNILGIYLLTSKRLVLSMLCFIIVPFIDIYAGIISIVLLATYLFVSRHTDFKYKMIISAVAMSIVISAIINSYYGFNIWHIFEFESQNIITDIGADIGMSFSIFILSIIGLVLLWENGWRNLITYTLMILFIIISFFNTTMRIYINFILVIYAGFAFIYLNNRKWSISIIKKTTTLLIICSILFSTMLYINKLTRSEPDNAYIDALSFIKKQALPQEQVLSSANNGYMIEYYTGQQAFIDSKTKYYMPERLTVMENISSSRNLERTEKLLQEYNIRYIFIDNDLSQYLKGREGLLFLMNTSKSFANIYHNDKIDVWMYAQ